MDLADSFGDNRCSVGVVGTPDKLVYESETVLKNLFTNARC